MRSGGGGPTAGNDVGPLGRPSLSYLGFPVELTDQLPGNTTLTGSPAILFGNLALSATFGDRRGVTIRRLTERFGEYDQVAFIVSERFDYVGHDLGDNSTPGGVVALVGG